MEDLSLHILDIAENSVAAGADKIEIRIWEDEKNDRLSIEVIDNGIGMDEETVKKAMDPFYTSKTVRRFGLGLPMLSESAKAANGHLTVTSQKGVGTTITAVFQYSHIDRRPLGDVQQTLITLIIGNPDVDLIYVHKKEGRERRFDTRKIRARLAEIPLNSPAAIRMIRKDLARISQIL